MSLSRNIKQILTLLDKAIKQTPLDKQTFLTHKVTRVVNKFSALNPEANQPTYLKELEFNLNFIRLSFPHLDYSPPVDPKEEKDSNQQPVEEDIQQRVKEEFV